MTTAKTSKTAIESLEKRQLLSVTPVVLATPAGGVAPQLAVDYAGNVYGTTLDSNTSAGTIFAIPAGSSTVDTIDTAVGFGPIPGEDPGGANPRGILIDPAGNLFLTLTAFESSDTDIYESVSGPGDLTGDVSINDQPGALTTAVDPQDDVFGFGTNASSGSAVTYAFKYSRSTGFNDLVTTTDAQSPAPAGIACDSMGNAFVIFQNPDFSPGFVSEYSTSGTATTLYTFGAAPGNRLSNIAVDSSGDVFLYATRDANIATSPDQNTAAPEILELKAGGTTPTVLASLGLDQNLSADPGSFVTDSAGNLYSIESASSSGSTSAGSVVESIVEVPAGTTSLQTLATFSPGVTVSGLAIDQAGNVYCTDQTNVYELKLATSKTYAQPTTVATISGGFGQIVVDKAGDAFGTLPATNTSAGSIFEIPAGTSNVQTLATFGPIGSTNTLGFGPSGILLDAAGNLFGVASSDTTVYGGGTPYYLNDTEFWELPVGQANVQILATEKPGESIGAIDSADDLFGTGYLFAGGLADSTAFELSKSGNFTTLASVFNTQGPAPTAIACDAAGNAFIIFSELGPAHVSELAAGTTGHLSTVFTGDSDYLYALALDAGDDLFLDEPSQIVKVDAGSATANVLYALNSHESLKDFAVDSVGDLFAVLADSTRLSQTDSLIEVPVGQSSAKTIATFNTGVTISDLAFDGKENLYCTDGTNILEFPGVGTPPIDLTPTAGQTVGLNPSLAASTVSPSIVSGVTFKGAVRVTLKPMSGGAATGIVTTKLYAATSVNTGILLQQLSQRYRGGKRPLSVVFHLDDSLAVGSYHLVAQTTDAAGNIVASTQGETIIVSAPVVDVSANITAITPKVKAGGSGFVILNLTNTGNIAAVDELAINLSVPDDFSMLNQTLHVKIPDSREGIRVRLRFSVPTGTPAGSYDPVVTATEDVITTTSTRSHTFVVR